MKTFVIQCDKKKIPMHDFGFQLMKSIEYNQWICAYGKPDYKYILSETINDKHIKFIPIGSVEFVLDWFKLHNIKNIAPLNVPSYLWDCHTNRKIYISSDLDKTISELNLQGDFILKDNKKIKGFCTKIDFPKMAYGYMDELALKPVDEFFISEYIPDIISEWRCFVYANKLEDARPYLGDFKIIPDYKVIEDIISKLDGNAYTVDVGISPKVGTSLIEVHDFFSCGLYGYFNPMLLPTMFISSINKLLKLNNVSEVI